MHSEAIEGDVEGGRFPPPSSLRLKECMFPSAPCSGADLVDFDQKQQQSGHFHGPYRGHTMSIQHAFGPDPHRLKQNLVFC